MSLGGGPRYNAVKYTGLQVQTSTSLACIPICWGANRVAPNLIWYDDFKAVPNKVKGKGGGKQTVSYDYSASVILALGYGPGHGIGTTWKDQSTIENFSDTHFTYFSGADPQSPWSYLVANHPAEALSYNGVAYLAQANLKMGSSPTLPSATFEYQGLRYGSQVGGDGINADCALVVQDYVSDPGFGIGISSTLLDNLLSTGAATTTGDSAYQTYCRAIGFGFSPALTTQEQALSVLDRWAKITNTACFWTGYSLKLVPFGDQTITANGVTYLPPITPVYHLNDDDYLHAPNENPVKVARTDPAQAYNAVRLTINDRANNYIATPIALPDQALVEQYGLRQGPDIQATEVCLKDMASIMVQLLLQRTAYIRNTYQFSLPPSFCLLEPMDVVTLTDSNIGLVATPVRIISIDEDEQGNLKIEAEQLTVGLSSAVGFTPQGVTNTPQNQATVPSPVNPPVIFEPPSSLSQGIAQIWMAVSGGNGTTADPYWGGADVWVSTDGGSSYNQVGTIKGPAIQGKLTASLAAYGGANPDVTNTLAVSTAMSAGELVGGSASDAANGMLLSYADGELLSFETATLTGTSAYNLTTIYRGLFGTVAGSHSSGTQFARMDSSIFKYQLPPSYIGQTLYFKFPSFNIWNQQLQDLSTCTAYSYTPAGHGFGGGSGGVPLTPTGLGVTGGVGGCFLVWSPNASTDNVTSYSIYRAAGPSGSFGSAILVATVAGQAFADSGLSPSTTYTYFLVANNAVGSSSHTSGVDGTTSAIAVGPQVVNSAPASDVLVAGDLVHFWNDSGTIRVQHSDWTDDSKPADGYVLAGCSIGAKPVVYLSGINTGVTGLTPGYYFVGAAGATTATVPSGGKGLQVAGRATPAGNLNFEPGLMGLT